AERDRNRAHADPRDAASVDEPGDQCARHRDDPRDGRAAAGRARAGPRSPPAQPPVVNAVVELCGVAKSFGPVAAVQRIDLVVEEGSFVTLLGPSGCGKTTILRMIAGLTPPDAGDILIRGRRVNDIPIHRRNLGVVFQNLALFPHRTVFENVAYGLKLRSVGAAERAARVRRALD